MKCDLIMTVLGADRPGIVNSLAEIVTDRGGNWLESRMARMAGQFAGIVRIECAEDQVDTLIAALQPPLLPGLNVQVARETSSGERSGQIITVDVTGNDRPGIVRELSTAIASAGGNVEELTTGLESAPMSGHPMFHARGRIAVTEGTRIEDLTSAIEALGEDLTVDLEA